MSKNYKTFRAAILGVVAATTGIVAVSTTPVAAHKQRAAATPNIVETAVSTGVHTTLVAAVQAADLVGTLSGDTELTVFAPTDTAFAKLPDGTVETLVKPRNKGALTDILTYHVVPGRVTSGQLVNLIERHRGEATITTVSGGKLTARLAGDNIIITDAKGRATAVTTANVRTSNGIIHVTDGVFLPA